MHQREEIKGLVRHLINLYNFVRRVWIWLPILWKDRDWDYAYLLDIISFKLNRMEKEIESNKIIEASRRVGKQIRYAQFLLKIVGDTSNLPRIKKLEDELHLRWGDDIWATAIFNRKELPEEALQEIVAYFAICDKVEADVWKRLFRHLETYMKGWWD